MITDEGIQERGDHRQLIEENGLYTHYYNLQFEGTEPDMNEIFELGNDLCSVKPERFH